MLAQYREELDKQYRASRVMGEVIERRLEAYFLSNEPKALWHAIMDLLMVRYFHLIGLTTENLLKLNSGKEHSGLSVNQLRNQKTILDTYRKNLKKVAQAVLEGPIRPLAI
jgi:hypothetical protein